MARPTTGRDFHLAVIGGGSAGYAAASKVAQAGWRAVVIDGGAEVGGLCILRGCMPTKALLYAAEVRQLIGHAGTWGIEGGPADFDFTRVMARKDALIREFADYRREQLNNGRFNFIRGRARFTDPHTVALENGSQRTADHFLIATGSRVAEPPLAALAEVGFLTSDDALTLTALPRSLIVLGGGPVAVELAQFFVRFGVQVTLLQRSDHILTGFDTDEAETIERVFRREGMTLHTGTRLTGASARDGLKTVHFEREGQPATVSAEEILFALGRRPATDGLGLDLAGVAVDRRGGITTDAQMRTTAPHVFAAGDCTGQHEIVHIAIQQAELAAHNLLHPEKPRRIDYRLLTTVVFTDPQVACVGLGERDARRFEAPFVSATYPFSDHGKSQIMDARDGFVKLLADRRTGEILGGACVGPLGGELIHEIVAAMHQHMTVGELASMPHYHPTLAEIWTYPAEELAAQIPEK